MDLKDSRTKINLMRAFAGESQARNRYNIAANIAKDEGYAIIKKLFDYTADQERIHAKMFYGLLKDSIGTTIDISGGYPVDIYDTTQRLLKAAQHNEYEEWSDVYKTFGNEAEEDGFPVIAGLFKNIAEAEKGHGDRFGKYAKDIEEGTLFKKDIEEKWICTVCGYIYEGKEAPKVCPVCRSPQGYYILYRDYMFE